tara:strand:+ start:88 stop:411 length:324 start_codon:yes stop_codon:yes gene_type:complete
MNEIYKNLSNNPIILNFITIMAGLAFFLLCMLLPLVGPAGSKVEHADYNNAIFTGWLIFTLILSSTSYYFRYHIYRIKNDIFPKYSLILTILCIIIFLINILGGFSI